MGEREEVGWWWGGGREEVGECGGGERLVVEGSVGGGGTVGGGTPSTISCPSPQSNQSITFLTQLEAIADVSAHGGHTCKHSTLTHMHSPHMVHPYFIIPHGGTYRLCFANHVISH